MRSLPVVLAIASLTVLSGCGHRQPERAEGGAATGAATGATVGLVGGPVGVVAGGLIGGAAGAATGAATKSSDVNLGAPPWQDNTKAGTDRRQAYDDALTGSADLPTATVLVALPRLRAE